jgi:hypothetical protein
MSFTLLASRFSVRVQVRFKFGAAEAASDCRPGFARRPALAGTIIERWPLNAEPNMNMNTNREVRTLKFERQILRHA